jgi:hypothetical protein
MTTKNREDNVTLRNSLQKVAFPLPARLSLAGYNIGEGGRLAGCGYQRRVKSHADLVDKIKT